MKFSQNRKDYTSKCMLRNLTYGNKKYNMSLWYGNDVFYFLLLLNGI